MVGPASLMQAMWVGGTVYLPERPSHKRFMQWVRERGIDSAWVSVHQLDDEPRPDDRDHRLRFAYTDDIPGDRIDEFERRFGVKARNSYGMTEIGLGTIVPVDDDEMARAGSIGIPAPLRECKVIAPDLSEITEPGRVGELCVRGVGLFDGYHGCERAETGWLEDGWFRTGDLVRFDERGWFYFAGRVKDMIRRNGENISSLEVEHALAGVDGIALAAVVPAPDPRRGEEVRACIVLRAGLGVDDVPPASVRAGLAGRLAAYKHPRFIDYYAELPRTASDKIAKTALRDRSAASALVASFDTEEGSP
jgi:crotonobetaine/carnitine-CoA ligase